jgi:hypothetical protein
LLSGSSVVTTAAGLAGSLIAFLTGWVLQSRNDQDLMPARQPRFVPQPALT